MSVLQSPPSKGSWKQLCKARVVSWWEDRLRSDVDNLPSLRYFKPSFMSLTTIHPLWRLAESPFEVLKASTVAYMLSGQYSSDYHARHWSKTNPSGYCQLCLMGGHPQTPGTLEHMLLKCPSLDEIRQRMELLWSEYIKDKPILKPIIDEYTLNATLQGQQLQMQFLLDTSSCAIVISCVQSHGMGILSDLLYLTRTWCHSHHSRRQKMLKLYNII